MAILSLEGVSQEFGGLLALDQVRLEVEAGKVFGIIGPNGAGKTTLFNIITGIYTPSSGQVIYKEKAINGLPPYELARLGIARTFQNIRLFNKLSVLDNVKVGFHGVTKAGFFGSMLGLPGERREEKAISKRAHELLEMVGLDDKKMEYADSLAYGEQRRLEIARALALNPSLLLLDEPAAGMNASEKLNLMSFIEEIRDHEDLTILLVEHDMNVVMNICDQIAVLDYGRKIADGPTEEVKNDPRVIQSYLGVEA
ncbi:MAG: ABC transporter ATP-binding protein [Syntrophomonadaceae bacterium]|jgi:branched-chain amino acid transport system ATP-binding protein|nr:ABC transporter ATP-binding protein [Syntrophomonadaceae bacterium]